MSGFFVTGYRARGCILRVATVLNANHQLSAAAERLSSQGHQPRENPRSKSPTTFGLCAALKRRPQEGPPSLHDIGNTLLFCGGQQITQLVGAPIQLDRVLLGNRNGMRFASYPLPLRDTPLLKVLYNIQPCSAHQYRVKIRQKGRIQTNTGELRKVGSNSLFDRQLSGGVVHVGSSGTDDPFNRLRSRCTLKSHRPLQCIPQDFLASYALRRIYRRPHLRIIYRPRPQALSGVEFKEIQAAKSASAQLASQSQ